MIKILKAYFEKESFNTFLAQDGEEALEIFYTNKIDLAILDWMMPKMNGIQVCKEIKKQSKTKVLLLTAKDDSEDELIALQSGADEYVSKPFDPRVLILRAKKLMHMDTQIFIGDLKIDMEGQKIFRKDKDLQATNKEFHIMKYLIENRGIIISRKDTVPPLYHLNLKVWDQQKETIEKYYNFFSPLHKQAALLEMTQFDWLSPDRLVQKTGDKLENVANYSSQAFAYTNATIPTQSVWIHWLESGEKQIFTP
jgi:DNA-binding response OmpR family regulator